MTAAHAQIQLRSIAPAENPTLRIKRLTAAGSCAEAAAALKEGVKAKHPDVLLLAGTMYEDGACLAPNWERAVNLYMLADQAGNRGARLRLVAGYARAGRDNGLALWWMAKARDMQGFPAACLPRSDPDNNPNGFNDELERMAPAVFRSCVYAAGVVAEVSSQVDFPMQAAYSGVSGAVTMEFTPALGAINWVQNELTVTERQPGGIRDLAKAELDNPRAAKTSLLRYLGAKGEFALSRYQRPEGGLAADVVLKRRFVFTLD
jgi:hypothetical protein